MDRIYEFLKAAGTYYLPVSGDTATIREGAAAQKDMTSGKYVKVTVADDHTLTITPVSGTRAGTVNYYDDFAGTIAVEMKDGYAVKYTKPFFIRDFVRPRFSVRFSNVAPGSEFTNLRENDSVTTATLAAGESVTVNGGGTFTAAAI